MLENQYSGSATKSEKGKYAYKAGGEDRDDKAGMPYESYTRYYPTDNRGQVDEWAAVIKHQEEMYKNEVERRKMQKQVEQK